MRWSVDGLGETRGVLTEEEGLDSVGGKGEHFRFVEKGQLAGHLRQVGDQGLKSILERVDVSLELVELI